MLAFWIARRYIFSRRTLQFISVITVLSVAGITVGVAAIICVSSIFNGFRDVYQRMMIEFDPHLRLSAEKGAYLPSTDSLLRTVQSIPEVNKYSPLLRGRVVITHGSIMHIGEVQGIRPGNFGDISGIRDNIVLGTFVQERKGELPGVVIGVAMGNKIHALPGDTLSLLSPTAIEGALQSGSLPQGIPCIVQGIFMVSAKEYSEQYLYADTQLASRLLGSPASEASIIDIRLQNISQTDAVAQRLRSQLPPGVRVETWYDLHKDLYGVMQFERYASFVILCIIVLVAVFNIFALLTMTVVKKRGDIALLQSIGADERLIRNIFLWEGLTIGITGTILGVGLGLALCFLQIEFALIPLNTANFIISAVPVKIAWIDVIAIVCVTIFFSFVATIYPARRAAHTLIARALRAE